MGNIAPSIEQRVKEVAIAHYCVEQSQVIGKTKLEALGDSLDAVEFVMTLEDEFDITIDDEVAEHLDTIQGYIDLIINLKAA